MRFVFAAVIAAVFSLSGTAAPNRIAGPLDSRRMQALPGNTHRLASARFDRGVADAALPMNYVMMLMKPSAAQQTDLDMLLRDRQNPSSPNFQAWLSPEQFADRFGLSLSDQSKIVSWLTREGLTVHAPARGRNWIAFSGTAGKISSTFHTSIHRYEVNGEMHFANAGDPSVPAAMAGLVGGFTGLQDFRPKSQARLAGRPDFTSGKSHYLAPGDFSTIYDVAPLAQAGYDGTGQSIAVVGQSDILTADISAFRSDFGLPASAPRQVLFGADPGFNGDELESNLDLEWTGALAPKATIYYVYATNAFNAMLYAVAENLAPVISVSYGTCENDSLPAFRSVAQQANAQGITIVAAAGDAGGAGCDLAGDLSLATHGSAVGFPSNLPEVTGMGGTMFNEGSGSYWAPSNSATFASALSYIPEVVWNETSPGSGLSATGGGASASIAKPDWQTGPGVPSDGARDVPDLALSSALHDAYLITYQGNNLIAVGGTSTAAPSMSGILALLNQYVVKQGLQKTAGLGNINPQLYRMAQSVPAAFHDIVSGNNGVPCLQGSPGCATGSYGYAAGPGYDQVTGIGSVDANVLVTSWGQAVSPVSVTLSSSAAKVTVNDTVTVTATVSPAGLGVGTPTGTVNFLLLEQALGSGTLTNVNGQQMVSVTIPAWVLGVGTSTITAQYAGNAAFSGGGASIKIQATLPTTAGVAAISAQVPGPVFAFQTGTQPLTWQAGITLQELAGVPAVLTGFTVDGQAQPLSQYFPSPDIPAGGTLTGSIVFTSLAVPVIRTFGFTGTDLSGSTWSRQVQVQFRGLVNEEQVNFNLWATPLTIQQNPGAATNCQWPQQITLDEITGYELHVIGLLKGSVDVSNTIPAVFGTTRLAPWGSLQGTLCWNPATTPSSDLLEVITTDDFGDEITQELNVNFTGPAGSAVQLSTSPASIALKPPVVSLFPVPQTLTVNLSDKTQPWTATVFPVNRTTTWLTLSQYAGTGPATLTVQTNGTGFEPGVYRATIVVQSPNSVPQYLAVPVMFVNTPTPNGPAVSSVGNALSFTTPTSPGMIMAVYGSQLASGTQSAATLPLGNSLSGTSATVNGYPAPLFYVSPTQLNIQVPYEVGAGPAVLGINNNGQVGGFQFQLLPAAPGIFTVNGATYPTASANQGAYATIFVTGTGELNQAQPSGVAVATGTPASSLPLPLLPINVTVGGVRALIQFAGSPVGVVGLTQVNFVVPPTVAPGVQPVVVTAGGYPSAPANLTVTTP